MAPKTGPLTGTIIIDMTMGLAGPYGTFLLAAMGARVIKIEMPSAGGEPQPHRNAGPFLGRDGISMARRYEDDISISNLQLLRGIESVSIDLKQPEGREIFLDLVRQADVVFQNLSRGAADRLGCGYKDASAVNPRIVYTSITGTGSEDKSGSGKTFDTVVQAQSGVMMTTGQSGDGPVRHGLPIADLITPLYAVIGTLAAMSRARETGQGEHVDVSMLGALTTLLATDVFDEMEFLGFPMRTGPTVPRLAPLGVYPSADGHIAICTISDERFAAMAEATGMPELAKDPRFATRPERVKNYKAVDEILGRWTSSLPAAEAAAILERFGVPAGAVRSTFDALRDPRVREHGDVAPLSHPIYGATHEVYGPGIPIKFGDRVYAETTAVPTAGEHNQSVLADLLGYDDERFRRLKAQGTI